MSKTHKVCYMCNKIIESHEESIMIQPRGGRMRYYHETCVERERVKRGHTNNLHTN